MTRRPGEARRRGTATAAPRRYRPARRILPIVTQGAAAEPNHAFINWKVVEQPAGARHGIVAFVLVRKEVEQARPPTVRYREVRGTREEKYLAASETGLASDGWLDVSARAPFWSFAPADHAAAGAYDDWPSVVEVFPVSSSGIQTSHDDLVTDVTVESLEAKIRQVADRAVPDETLKERFAITENPRCRWSERRRAFTGFDDSRIIPLALSALRSPVPVLGSGFRPMAAPQGDAPSAIAAVRIGR
jgi:hypothetical protein